MSDIEEQRAEYRRIRAKCIAATGMTARQFDRDAESLGTQDGEGEPATATDYIRGALEIAHDCGVFVGGWWKPAAARQAVAFRKSVQS